MPLTFHEKRVSWGISCLSLVKIQAAASRMV
jgi:hypothetical protein